MRLLFIFMQNPWQCLVWWVDGGFNGGTVCRRRLLQQGYIRGYGSHIYIYQNQLIIINANNNDEDIITDKKYKIITIKMIDTK